jgi:hypothetical protein
MEHSNTKEFVIEDNDFLIRNGVLTKKEWCEIIAGVWHTLRKETANIIGDDAFSVSGGESLDYTSYKLGKPLRLITPTFLGDYLKIRYCSEQTEGTLFDKPYVYINTVHDRTSGKLINGCHVVVSKNGVTLGEVYIDLVTEQISGDIILRLGNIKDDILLEHTKLKYTTLKDKINGESSVVLSSIGVKYNGSLNNQIRDAVYEYNEAITNKLKQLLSETERKYADYFIANDPLNIMLGDMVNGLGLSTEVIADEDTTNK